MKTQTLVLALLMLSSFIVPLASADMGEATDSLITTPPGSGVDVTIPSDVAIRHVFGYFIVAGGTIGGSQAIAQACAGGTDYQASDANVGESSLENYAFTLKGGSCYEFVLSVGAGGGTSNIQSYSYIDIMLESFEGRAHANATRLEMNTTRTTQNDIQNVTIATKCDKGTDPDAACVGNRYANETFCGGSGNCSGNFSGNFSGNYTSGNVSGDNVSVMGNMTIVSEWDGYIPLVWLGAMVLFMWLNALFPAVVMFLCFGDRILENATTDASILGPEARFMLAGIAVMLHLILAKLSIWYQGFVMGDGEAKAEYNRRKSSGT